MPKRKKSRGMLWIVGFAVGGLVGTVFWIIWGHFQVGLLKSEYAVVDYHGPKTPFTVRIEPRRPMNWVSLSQISKVAQGAVIVSEDWAFYQHPGYDINQIKDAIEDSVEEGELKRGASTITQQVVKNVFLSRRRSLLRKASELGYAVMLEQVVGKNKILETYFNIAEWGEGIFGIRAASLHYFGKPPSELNAREGAFLAMLLPSPKRYAQSFKYKILTDFARRSIASILSKMEQAHYITEEEKLRAMNSKMSFEL